MHSSTCMLAFWQHTSLPLFFFPYTDKKTYSTLLPETRRTEYYRSHTTRRPDRTSPLLPLGPASQRPRRGRRPSPSPSPRDARTYSRVPYPCRCSQRRGQAHRALRPVRARANGEASRKGSSTRGRGGGLGRSG